MPDSNNYSHPTPISTPETEEFWSSAREGRFLVPKCNDCGQYHWYPRRVCPHCMSHSVDWLVSPGTGRVYSYTVMRHAKQPFVLAYVTLDEGPTMLTHLIGKDLDQWEINAKVQVQFAATDGEYPVPVFGPATSVATMEVTA